MANKPMKPHYQHLAHHAVWDAVGNNQTTHDDIIRAMRGYDKGGYVSVLERGDMSSPAYRAQLEREQALENVYPETFLAPAARGLSAEAKKAKTLFESSKATGPAITKPIGWNLQKSMDEMLGYTQPAPVLFNPRTAEEIAQQALKKVPQRLYGNVKENAPRNVVNSANDLSEIVRVYKEDQNKAEGGSVEPKKTVKAYKLFRVHPKHPGKLFPLFVDANTPVEMNKWVDAKEGEMKNGKVKSKIGDLAYRPGWHAGDLPIATHIGEKSHPSLTAPDQRPANHAWAEVEMPDDVDWQTEATKRGTNAQGRVVPVKAHITDQIPEGGHYRYKTNPNMTGNWLIGGSMKVNKVLSDADVARINKDAGMSDLPRAQPFKKKEFGFATGGCVAPQEWKAEEYVNHKAKGGMLHLAIGGNVSNNQGATMHPSMAQMRMALAQRGHSPDAANIGVNEAPGMSPKHFFPPDQSSLGMPSPGGVATTSGMPIGGIDANRQQSGQQLMPQSPAPQAPPPGQPGQPPQGSPQGAAPQGPTPPMGNMLSMTPQGQTMGALGDGAPQPPNMAKGGSMSTDDMKREMAQKQADDGTSSRVKIAAEGPGGVKGIVVPRHMWEGKTYKGEGGKKVEGMKHVNAARAQVYGSENREPLTIGQIGSAHKKTLAEHFKRPMEEQTAAEEEALNKLRAAKHIGQKANTLDKSEKLDTVNHETDEEGRNYVGFASKGVAGHSLYTSGQGENMKHHVINTCPGQTVGCGGGADKNGIIDTSKGTCFAPNAEAQYVNAAVRRASHEQAKHDPAMTHDWILAHTGSLRQAANTADKKNKVLLFRPNVVDETDVSSRHAIRHLNEQRKEEGKPSIIANSYGKTNELHDPENGYYVTHSNVGPKVKKGQSIEENISRDKARVRNTVAAADNRGDFKNEQGNLTPPKNSYMVTDVKRGSPMAQNMEKAITHAKYWSTGRHESELSPEELAQGPEGHYGSNHKPTAEENAHYGHRTLNKKRYDYQKQHILHPRLVQVGHNDDGTPHMIPTDSRFKDEEFLPKNRFVSKNGKKAGAILMTTPTESTSNVGHETSFTHHVGPSHIKHALENKGEYEIDKPEEQEKAAGKEYTAPQAIKLPSTMKLAEGGMVSGRHPGLRDDDFHAFPEQNVMAQRHLAMRHGEDEKAETSSLPYHAGHKKAVVVHQSLGAMHLEMLKNKKAK